ncbi:MAG: CopG family ribbon-helix-helix protein [Rubrobacteraceae bacterium]
MRRFTLTLPKDLETRFEAHIRDRGVSPSDVVEDALRAYLENDRDAVYLDGEAHPAPEKPLRFTPAERGSGKRDMSANHDEYLTEE